jgi:RNA polymerase sigma-70 factor (ECF subfamily)
MTSSHSGSVLGQPAASPVFRPGKGVRAANSGMSPGNSGRSADGSDRKPSRETDLDEDADPDADRDADPESDPDAVSDDLDPQPGAENGVEEDMATIALGGSLENSGRLSGAGLNTGLNAGRSATRAELSAMSDAEIMLRVREGDDSGFEYLIQKYHRPMIHFMFRMVHNQAVAEELAQEVFLRVYRSRHSYRAEAKFTTWLYRIATNLGVNHARDTKYERAAQNVYLDQPDPETGTTPDVADLTASVEQELVKDERMRAIRQHVLALPERQRTAVLMHKYQGLDYKQIGEVLKLSESATKSLLFRAYQTLRERLKEFV